MYRIKFVVLNLSYFPSRRVIEFENSGKIVPFLPTCTIWRTHQTPSTSCSWKLRWRIIERGLLTFLFISIFNYYSIFSVRVNSELLVWMHRLTTFNNYINYYYSPYFCRRFMSNLTRIECHLSLLPVTTSSNNWTRNNIFLRSILPGIKCLWFHFLRVLTEFTWTLDQRNFVSS